MAKDNKNHGKLLLDNGKVIVMWVCIFYKNTLFFILLFFFVAVYLFRFALSFFKCVYLLKTTYQFFLPVLFKWFWFFKNIFNFKNIQFRNEKKN